LFVTQSQAKPGFVDIWDTFQGMYESACRLYSVFISLKYETNILFLFGYENSAVVCIYPFKTARVGKGRV
jgi:hypothetical protein